MRLIRTTFQTVTEESAKDGDYSETGWVDEEGTPIEPDSEDIWDYGSELNAVVALAVKAIGKCVDASDYPTCHPGHTWYTDSDPDRDMHDGSETTQSYHLVGFLPEEEIAIYKELVGK